MSQCTLYSECYVRIKITKRLWIYAVDLNFKKTWQVHCWILMSLTALEILWVLWSRWFVLFVDRRKSFFFSAHKKLSSFESNFSRDYMMSTQYSLFIFHIFNEICTFFIIIRIAYINRFPHQTGFHSFINNLECFVMRHNVLFVKIHSIFNNFQRQQFSLFIIMYIWFECERYYVVSY